MSQDAPTLDASSAAKGPKSPLLAALEARQDEVLRQLEELNKQLEAALKQYSKAPAQQPAAGIPAEKPSEKKPAEKKAA